MAANALELSEIPYPGLRPFRASEADIFFGRERQTDELLARLAAHRFLSVIGPSGCGKSSLVAAGLMPALATGFMASAGAHWRVAKLRPGERPLHYLARALLDTGVLDPDRAEQPDAQVFLEAALRRGPLGLVEILRGSALPADVNLLVFVDQFEELFRFSAGVARDDAEAFVALLLASCTAPRQRLYVVLTMRSDFLGECAPFHGLPEAINDGLYLAPRLTRDECAACITGPARVFDGDVEPALVNRLLNDFGPDPDQLPLLQHALLRMWNRHDADRQQGETTILRVADYEAIGGLARSLSDHADEAFHELSPTHQRVAKLMLQRLSDSETVGRDRRAPAHVQDIAELAEVGLDDVRQVADAFRRRDRCFLMPREGIELRPDSMLDISHESLLRQWDHAVRWIAEEAEAVTTYRRLLAAARGWRDGESLLSAAGLDRALIWRAGATTTWALRYATRDDFQLVCDLIAASDAERKLLQDRRTRAMRGRRTVVATALGTLAVASLITWPIWPLLYTWEHAAYYASRTTWSREPHGLGELSGSQVRHRPLSYRVVTAGRLGPVLRMEAVNSAGDLTDVNPDYQGTERGRFLTTSRWVYAYDAGRRVASELQYSRLGELVQGKIYVDAQGSRRAVFIDADGTPIAVRGRSTESNGEPTGESTYYWAENVTYSLRGRDDVETTGYLGLSGEPVPNGDRAFATERTYDQRGYNIAVASLDASGHLMNDAAGNATWRTTNDEFNNALDAGAFDDHGQRTRLDGGWATRRQLVDAFGNIVEMSYFDEKGQPISTEEGWHRQRLTRDEQGSVTERRYYGPDGAPARDAALSCYGSKEQHDTLDGLIRWTCLDAAGEPRQTSEGYVTQTRRYDSRGREAEETTRDGADQPVASRDAVAARLFGYDASGRRATVRCLGANGRPVINHDGYAKSITSYDPANHSEGTQFYGVDGEPVEVKAGYASVQRRHDLWWNIIEERRYDVHGSPVVTNDGSAGWRATFDARGEEIERVLLGKAGEAVLGKDGYASWRAEYDDLGRRAAVHYLDLSGNAAVKVADGVAGWRAEYDRWGNETKHTYLGLDDRPTHSIHGEAGWRAEYDRWGHQIRRQYIDTRGSPALHAWREHASFAGAGYALLTWALDAQGHRLQEAYFGVREERISGPEGWSYVTYTYDELGHEIERSYFGVHGEPARFSGFHTVRTRYDDRYGMEWSYFDTDDKTPIRCNGGFARMVRRYDQNRNIVDERMFGMHGEPVVAFSGSHHKVIARDSNGRIARIEYWGSDDPPNKLSTTEVRYDDRGNRTAEWNLDSNGNPVATRGDACAVRRWRYSDRQELLEELCLDARGEVLSALHNGAARIAYAYGRPGQKIAESYYDEAGRPFTVKQGYTAVRYKVDLSGRTVEETYVDAAGNQVLTVFGYARTTRTYDEHGDLLERALFDANDRPTIPVAKIVNEYDSLRRKVKEVYLAPGGKPARLNDDGQHVTLYGYDGYGNLLSLRYFDAQGRPTRGYAREYVTDKWQLCGHWLARYGDEGSLVGDGECEDTIPEDAPLPAGPVVSR
jgi:hypothetical protein